MNEKLQQGSERKFLLRMEPMGNIHLEDCEITKVEVFVLSNQKIQIDNSRISKENRDTYKIVVASDDAKALAGTNIKVNVYIGIPDSDFPDGLRNMIFTLCPKE